ncbi:MAG TPA: bacterioferritin [Acidimicrobiales bacterium]|nr:bacterioferritin [Acidimicrobiales bacterium]
MNGDPEIIELLNEVLTAELTAINQYFLDAKMLDNWGIERLAHHFRDASIDEMKDAERITDRILYLDGMPNYQRVGPLRIGETAMEKLNLALDLEREAIERYNRGVALARDRGDNGTRQLLAELLVDEEEHADWLESQLDAANAVGEANYLAQHLHEDD